MKKFIFLFVFIFSVASWGQTQIYVLDFETSGGYTTSMSEQTDNDADYFIRTDGSDISAIYNSPQGSYFFAAQDLNADGMSTPATLSIDDIDISGYTDLEIRIYIAEDDASNGEEDWDDEDYLHIDYDIDNSGTFLNGIWVENDGSTYNSAPYIDTDYDGVGDGTEITDTFAQFTKSISETGSLMDIKITFGNLDSSDEDIAIDYIEVWGTSAGPTLLVSPSSLSDFTYVEGYGPSGSQNFTLSGRDLDGTDVTLSAPSDYEISTDDTNFSDTLTFGNYDGSDQTIYVRLKADLTAGDYNEDISISGGGDDDGETVNLSGTVDEAYSEIVVEGNNIEIVDGDTTPSIDDNTDFGDVEVNGFTEEHTFVIKNTGNVDLTINSISSDNSEFAVSGTTSGTIAAGEEVNFTVTFDPSDLGIRTATISIDNDDNDENPYDFSVQGNGVNSSLSDIVTNANFTYTANIPYLLYQASPIESTNGSVAVFKFDIRDGGENGDADTVGTELTDIVFSVGSAHGAYILDAALFDEDNLLVNNPTVDATNGTITFAGLSGADFTADDDSVKSITLRVSFTDNVTDNEQLQFTVTSATANSNGSVFATSDAGGAQSSVSGDDNRIEVIADRIRFDVQPQDQVKNTDLTAFSIIAIDENDIKDLDATNEIDLTTSATGTMTHSSPYTMSGGEASITDVQFDTPQTDVTITATTSGLNYDNDDVSEPFDILDISDGSYRSMSDGTWKDESDDTTASWEQFVNGAWSAIDNQPPLDTSNTVYIYHNITLVGSNSVSDIVIEKGGTIDTNGVSQTITNLLVRNGGTYFKNSNGMSVVDSGVIEVEDGGTFKFLHTDDTSLSNNLWNGTEKFHKDSNFIIVRTDSTSDFQFMNAAGDVSEYDGGLFGNLIIDQNDGNLMLLPDNFSGTFTKGDLIIKNLADNIKFTKTGASCTIKGNLEIQSSVIKDITITTEDVSVTLNVEGDFIHNGTEDFRLTNSYGINPNVTMNIEGDLILSGTEAKFRPDINSNGTGTNEINLKGDLSVNDGSILYSENSNSVLNFVGVGDGLTPETTQTIDIATTDTDNENKNIQFNINAGAYVQIINQDFELGKNSKVTVKDGGIFDFGFNETTPLKVTISGNQTGTAFDLDAGGYLKITSPDGIMSDSSAGNVQVVASNTTFSTIATFHYVGKSDQVTGDAIGSSSNGRAIIVELASNSLKLTPSQSFGITDAQNTNINGGNGGILEIRKGIFAETDSAYITGSTGGLKMTDGTYQIAKLSDDDDDYIPRMGGLNNEYDLKGGTIELNGAGNQILRGSRDYRNLTFSNSGTKTISSSITSITGELYITDNAILDVENKIMGGAGTELLMDKNAIYKTAGSGVKPDAEGDYYLMDNSKIVFTNSATTLQEVRLTPEYVHIDVEGTNVGSESLTDGINISGTFTVKNGAVYKLKNTAGFNGGTNTAVLNTNSPDISLEEGSIIEYKGENQVITEHAPGYQNLTISGTDTKTLGGSLIQVNENLSLTTSGVTLSVEDEKTISVAGNVSNEGSIIIENKGSLVQTGADSTISGDGIYQLNKTSLPLNYYYDYVYWSSPIAPGNLTMGDILSDAWRYYRFDPTIVGDDGQLYPGWVMLSSTDVAAAGVGYAISAPENHTAGESISVSFVKDNDPFNNGDITVNVYKKDGDGGDNNLLGNPYPSAIDFNAFANDNAAIDASYSLWTNCAGLDADNHHQNSGYSTYVVSGTNTAACSDDGGTAQAGQYIATGQGFMVVANTDESSVTFKNSHRMSGNNTGFLNRPATDRDVVWVDIKDDEGHFNQIAVGFYEGATGEYDRMFDAKDPNTDNGFCLSSLLNGEKLVIQGLDRSEVADKTVPLFIENDATRNITFHLDHLIGFDNVDIYLRDNELNTTHDLKATDYLTTVEAGNDASRFELIFVRGPLEVEELEIDPETVWLTQNEGVFELKTNQDERITALQVYDVNGKLLYENNEINDNHMQVDLRHVATGNLLLFRTQINDKYLLVKKAIKK